MPLPENKTPFKTMDIKTALLAASNRKRKATSPTKLATPPKHLKISDDKKLNQPSEDEIEVIEPDADMTAIGDCKENTDCNVLKNEHSVVPTSEKTSSLPNVQTDCAQSESLLDSSQISCNDNSFRTSEDELNSSNLNNSLSAQNASELSDSLEKKIKKEGTSSLNDENSVAGGSESKLNDSTLANQNPLKAKRKKKMSFEEAKKRSEERDQKQKERLKKKEELDAEKLQRRLEKEKRKLEKQEQKEQEQKEKEEKEKIRREKKEQEEKEKQQKLKEKEEQKKQRQTILELKQEEKKKKEEMRLKREAELKQAEEDKLKAKLEKEQKEKEKQERNKAAFLKFFKTTTSPAAPQKPVEKEGAFKPFQVSDDMTLAPVVPLAAQKRFNREYLDHVLEFQDGLELYLQVLKSGNYNDVKLRKRQRRQKLGDADVIVMDNEEAPELFLTAKLLQFSENVRPPYWGTWRKRSMKIKPRNPFGEDEIFDYTVDSDDEWDEGGPGESLSGTENEVESEDDYEVDNEFFVPHGYLSAEEENEDEVENDPEKQKAVLKLKQQEFEKERKQKTTALKPIVLGCYFENVLEFQDPGLCNFLQAYTSEILCDTPIPTRFTVLKLKAEARLHSNTNSPSCGSASVLKKTVPEEALPDLIRLVHGNTNNICKMKKEFQVFWQQHCKAASPLENSTVENKEPTSMTTNTEGTPTTLKATSDARHHHGLISKRQLTFLIKEISTYGKCPNPNMKKLCWYVHDSVREKYGLLDAPIPNEWNYLTLKDETDTSPVAKSNSIKNILKQQ